MTSLSDTQRILLSTASHRENGSLLPLPASLKPGGGKAKAIEALVNRGLAQERETSDPDAVRRTNGDLRIGLFITAAGLIAIGIGPEGSPTDDVVGTASATPAAKTSKTTVVLNLLRRTDGVTLPELIEATGWLPHTTRAALTGIRKKGHSVERGKRDGATCYRIVVAG